ncbi:MAG: stage II sporulation protein P, partial [Peptococcaceae bacterium]
FVPEDWQHRFEKIQELTVSQEVQVILYHTHNAETYLPTAGVSKVNGENGGVVQAADVFQAALQQKYGIRTVHNTTLHDYPNWNRAYQNSLLTAQQLLQANPDAMAVFDIHRDAGFTSKEPTTTTINGKKAARIMLVIGANHETWKENLAFARQLEQTCNQLYPGLLRENIRIKETGRYNQQVHPHAVLLEIGSDLNTQEEADYAMECFAQVVAEVLQEQS